MPKTPTGAKRPRDVIANAVRVMQIATGEVVEERPAEPAKNPAAVELGRKGGLARAKSIRKADRVRIARKAAKALWRAKRQTGRRI